MKVEDLDARDHIAIEAMKALIAKTPFEVLPVSNNERHATVVRGAYSYAEQMLKERAKLKNLEWQRGQGT